MVILGMDHDQGHGKTVMRISPLQAVGGTLGLAAAISLLGRVLSNRILSDVLFGFPLIANSAICIISVCASIFLRRISPRLTLIVVLPALLISLATLYEYGFQTSIPGLDPLIGDATFIPNTLSPAGRIPPNSALAFFLIAQSRFHDRFSIFTRGALFTAMVLGIVGFAGRLLMTDAFYRWGTALGMGYYVALCLVIIPASLLWLPRVSDAET